MKRFFFFFCLTLLTILPLLSIAENSDTVKNNLKTGAIKNFSVTQDKQSFKLKWIGANENYISHFYVEKSFDGINYKQAGIVFSESSNSNDLTYQFPDKNTNKHKKIFYRLRTIDVHGNSTLSEVKNITLN